MPEITDEAIRTLRGLASGRASVVEGLLGIHTDSHLRGGLDPRTHALIELAAIISASGPAPAYRTQLDRALAVGATSEDVVGVLVAVAPHIGTSRVVSAAPAILRALGIDPGTDADPEGLHR